MTPLRFAIAAALILMTATTLHTQGTTKAARSMKERIPSWWSILPKTKNVSFVRAKAQSADKQLAIDKAAATARGDIIAAAEARWKELTQAIRAENPKLPAPPASDSAAVLRESRIAKQAAFRSRKIWTAYVLLEYPAPLVHDVLLKRLHAMPDWYALVKETRAIRTFESAGK